MIDREKYVSDEIIDKIPNWLVHFLWYLLGECMQKDRKFDGKFLLGKSLEGQQISYQIQGQYYEVNMPCPSAIDAQVAVICNDGNLVMKLVESK